MADAGTPPEARPDRDEGAGSDAGPGGPLRAELWGNRLVRCFSDRPASLTAFLEAAAAQNGAREALVDGDVRFDHAALEAAACAIAAALAERGVGPGERVILILRNRWEFVAGLLAVLRLGAVAVPVNVRTGGPETAHIATDCGACFALIEPEAADKVAGLAHAVVDDIAGWVEAGAAGPAPARPDEHATAIILYTSGTTGQPKGAMLSHANIVHSCLHYHRLFALTPADRALLAVPASHVTGVIASILAPLTAGGAVVIMRDFDAEGFVALAAHERITNTIVVPAMYNLMLLRADPAAHDLSAWRVGAFGGAPMPVATIERFAAAVPSLTLVNAYGATETTSPATVMPLGRQREAPASVGRPVPCADIRIMDEAGCEVAPGESGELWIGGPMVVSGYWNDPKRTAQSFPAGYWRSGDVGRTDEAGFVYIHDRLKDMINRGGYKVWSTEVENALAHHPVVAEAAVVPRADPVLGEKTHAVVHVTGPAPSEANLREHCAQHLSDYKIPDTFAFTDEPLPRNANGKLQKHLLRA